MTSYEKLYIELCVAVANAINAVNRAPDTRYVDIRVMDRLIEHITLATQEYKDNTQE